MIFLKKMVRPSVTGFAPVFLLASCFVSTSVAYAGNEIINHLTETIYSDCQNQSLVVAPFVKYESSGQPVGTLQWPWKKELLRSLLGTIVESEPFMLTLPSIKVIGTSPDGSNLLSCGNKILSANFTSYKWNGERVDPFEFNYNQIVQSASNIVAANFTQNAQIGTSSTLNNNQPVAIGNENAAAAGASSNAEVDTISFFAKNDVYLTGFTLSISLFSSLISIAIIELIRHHYRKRRKS